MKKGIVMEIDDAFLLLLTPEGEFMRAMKQNQPYAIGEEIFFFPVENYKTLTSQKSLKNMLKMKPIWGAIAAILIFLGTFIPVYQNNKAYAYMSIDVNPSIELGVNKKMQVVELNGFNKDGKKVISHLYKWQKKDVSELTKTILLEMKKEGYLKNHQQVILSTVRPKQTEQNAEEKLKENIEEIKETANKEHLAVKILNGTEKDREKAHELGITTGKYQEDKIESSKRNDNGQPKLPETKLEVKPKQTAPRVKQVLPPGQFKKQTENKKAPKEHSEIKGKSTEKLHKRGHHSAPGLIKKQQEKSKDLSKEESKQKHGKGHLHKIKLNSEINHWDGWNVQNDWNHQNNWNDPNDWTHHHESHQWDKSEQENSTKQHKEHKHE